MAVWDVNVGPVTGRSCGGTWGLFTCGRGELFQITRKFFLALLREVRSINSGRSTLYAYVRPTSLYPTPALASSAGQETLLLLTRSLSGFAAQTYSFFSSVFLLFLIGLRFLFRVKFLSLRRIAGSLSFHSKPCQDFRFIHPLVMRWAGKSVFPPLALPWLFPLTVHFSSVYFFSKNKSHFLHTSQMYSRCIALILFFSFILFYRDIEYPTDRGASVRLIFFHFQTLILTFQLLRQWVPYRQGGIRSSHRLFVGTVSFSWKENSTKCV